MPARKSPTQTTILLSTNPACAAAVAAPDRDGAVLPAAFATALVGGAVPPGAALLPIAAGPGGGALRIAAVLRHDSNSVAGKPCPGETPAWGQAGPDAKKRELRVPVED